MKVFRAIAAVATMGIVLAAGPALSAEHEVMMLNIGSDGQRMVFEPAFLQIEPGDTVTFLATDPTHNSEIIPRMLPEGAEGWKGRINEEVSVTFDQEGVYGYKCLPHYGMGMVGLIQVGSSLENLEEAKAVRHPGQARGRMEALFEELENSSN